MEDEQRISRILLSSTPIYLKSGKNKKEKVKSNIGSPERNGYE